MSEPAFGTPATSDLEPQADGQMRDAVPAGILRRMVDHAGIGLYEATRDGTLRYVNHALVHMLGYPTEEAFIAARPLAEAAHASPEEQRRFRETFARTGEVHGILYSAERLDGSRVWLNVNAETLTDDSDQGQIIGFAGSVSDVTEVVEAQRRLANAEAEYLRLFERATEGIYRSSLDGRQLRANPALAALNGYDTPDELLNAVGDIASEWYVDPKRRAEFKRLLHENGYVADFESEIYRHRTRERIWISENAYVVYDEAGNPLYFEGTVREITQRKQAEAATRAALNASEAANRSKSRFLAHMSHELRTPLNAILGFSDMIRQLGVDRIEPEKIREYADDIHGSGQHLLELVNDVLDLSRIENNAMPLNLEAIDPANLVDSALATFRPIADGRNIAVNVAVSPSSPALVDRRAMHQCLLNLLSNAVKFSDPGSEVRLLVEPQANSVVFSVEDTGIGINARQLARIGEPFNIDHAPDRSPASGTGLGLAITRSLIILMQGRFDIQSTPGVGTKVVLEVPLHSG